MAIAVQGYPLVLLLDMRIHDITVVADPNKRLPAAPDPVEADGTAEGSFTEGANKEINSVFVEAETSIQFYWTGW